MARNSKKVSKADVAALETESNEAIAMMAMELTTEVVADVVAEIEAIETVTEEDVVSVVEALEASEAVSEPEASEGEPTDPVASFDDVLASISQEERIAATVAMANAVDERAAFEAAGGNENIQKSLKAARIAFTMPDAGAVLLACGVDEAFVNRSVHDGKRYNVYALGKLADAVNGLAKGAVTNRINNAIMRSLFAARKANIPFTGEMAKAAASDKIRLADKKIEAILVRHTVSTVTAATQASSTMQALETLGLVARSGHKNPVYTLTNSPAVARLEQVLSQAA